MTDDYGDDIDRLTKKIAKLGVRVTCQNGITAGPCEYTALGSRCTFPGTISPNAGCWYCRFHYQQRHGGLTEAEAATKVREHRSAGNQPGWREAALQARMAELRSSGDEMIILADKLATGHGDREDKTEFLKMFVARRKGFTTSHPEHERDASHPQHA